MTRLWDLLFDVSIVAVLLLFAIWVHDTLVMPLVRPRAGPRGWSC